MNPRITVIKKTLHMDIIEEHLPNLAAIAAPCSDLRDAQAFEVQDDHIACTEGFCAHAWKTIGPVVTRVCRGERLNGPDASPPLCGRASSCDVPHRADRGHVARDWRRHVRIIGAIGKNGSGKDEVLRYLRDRYGVPFVATGDIVRALAAEEGLDPTRENLGAISARVFAEKGPAAFVRMAAEEIAGRHLPVAGISGIRSARDVRMLKDLYGHGFILVHVAVSNDDGRFERMRRRAEARDPVDVRHFRELDRREEEQFHLSEAAALADFTLTNDGALADLHTAIDRLVSRSSLLGPAN